MATTQDYINQLKIDKQNLVSMLNNMGVEATNTETFTSLTPKVGKIVTDSILQDKSIEITENGTQIITADAGYDGLNEVEVITNVASSGGGESNEYIQDGLIAWFDGEDDLDENGRWNSKIGDDYFYQSYPSGGTQMKDLKTSNAIVNDGTFCARNTADYLLQDYTIEVVGGMIPGQGNALLTFNKTKSIIISVGQQNPGELSLQNTPNAVDYYDKVYGNLFNKRFSCAINLLAVAPRGTASYNPRLLYSVNGSQWYFWGFTPGSRYSGGISVSSASGYKSLTCTLLSYYEAQYPNKGEVNCIRVYNRRLTEDELKHNYEIDKARFNLDIYKE